MWLLVGLALWWCLTPVRAWGVSTSASAAVLMDADTGQVLYDHNGSRRMLIASTTKIMTALVVLERASPGEEVTVRQEHMTEGSSMYLKPGERVTVEELLYGLLLCSGNDAAAALADHCGGTASFVRRMNGLARELGMEDTSFANPSGLDDDGHYSTARDMARLAVYAAGNHTFARLCSTRSVTVGGRTMTNHNRLLRTVPGCIGMKTGYTRAAGRTLVSAAERDGRRLVAVTLQDGNDWADHAALYDWGFAQETRQETAALNREDTAEDLLRQGRVQVNGQLAALGDRADPETDAVTLDGQPLSREPERVYLMLNKPRGYVTTLSDERGRRTAAELVSGCGARVYPVGRLDMDSEGLLLMTNDGAWMQRLLHPSREIEKEYRVTVTGPVEGAAGRLAAIRDLEGERIRPVRVRELWRDGNKAALSVTIHEGKNRQIRRMCRQAGLAVRRLQRVREHTLTLGDLPVGRWRYLTQQELQMLEGSEKR